MKTFKVTLNNRINADLNLSFTTEYLATDEAGEDEALEAGRQMAKQITAFTEGFAETLTP